MAAKRRLNSRCNRTLLMSKVGKRSKELERQTASSSAGPAHSGETGFNMFEEIGLPNASIARRITDPCAGKLAGRWKGVALGQAVPDLCGRIVQLCFGALYRPAHTVPVVIDVRELAVRTAYVARRR